MPRARPGQSLPHRDAGPFAIRPGRQVASYRGSGECPVPGEMSTAEINEAVAGFASAAVRAREAGFEGVEIHGVNGYLLDQFQTEGVNQRIDDCGSEVANRLRIKLQVSNVVRAAVGPDFIVDVRSSHSKVNDFIYK